jgi:integrase
MAFLDAAHDAAAHERTLCLVLTYTGCQVVEALQLTAADIDLAGDTIFLGAQYGQLRGVPVPQTVIQSLEIIHGVSRAQKMRDGGRSAKLWTCDRTTAWRWICRIMKEAGVQGPQAAPRGLRHGFAVDAFEAGVPLATVRRWMGYQDTQTP